MAERTELKPLPIKVRPGLIASGILDIVYTVIAYIVNVVTLAMISDSVTDDALSDFIGMFAILLFGAVIVMLVFGIITITLCAKKPEEFKAKKKLLVTSLVFVSVVLFFQVFFMTEMMEDAADFIFGGIFLFGAPIASIVLKSLALKRKEFVAVTVTDEPVAPSAPPSAPPTYEESYTSARSGNRQEALRRLQLARMEGRISAEEYERQRKIIMETGLPEPETASSEKAAPERIDIYE